MTPAGARAGGLTVAWDANPEPFVAGYIVYVSTQAATLGDPVDAGYNTVFTYSGTAPDTTYYFSVAAYERTDGGIAIGLRSAPVSIHTAPVSAPPATTPPAPVTLTNGGFESGIAGWTATGNQYVVAAGSWWGISEGTHAVAFNGGDSAPGGVVSRTIATTAGQSYAVVFDVGALSKVNRDEQRMLVTVTGAKPLATTTVAVAAPGNGTTYTTATVTFVADSAATTLRFQDASAKTVAVDLLLDNVRVTASGR